ncbi:hypothetical protein [Rhabdochromatium marinum]|uniref:hypothetical protein n=1 Tax=Rhabdochromatium marinum TaxID=48729 RepID=UPI0019050181
MPVAGAGHGIDFAINVLMADIRAILGSEVVIDAQMKLSGEVGHGARIPLLIDW